MNKDLTSRLAETSLGNCILSKQGFAPVNIIGNIYLEKPLEDLAAGDMVIYFKQEIDKTLDEIEPFLSPRYFDARDKIHATDDKGNRIPIFRHDLGLFATDLELISRQSFDANIFKPDGADFSTEEYISMVRNLRDMIEDSTYNHRYAWSTVRDWHEGIHLAPREWDEVFSVLEEQSDVFKKYLLPKSEGGIHDHYSLYVVIRQGIMRYLKSKGQKKLVSDNIEDNPENIGISLKQEIELVLSAFMKDIDENYALARVNVMKDLNHSEEERVAREKPAIKLTRRVIANEPAENFGKKLTYPELLADHKKVSVVMVYATAAYFRRNLSDLSYTLFKEAYPQSKGDMHRAAVCILPSLTVMLDPRKDGKGNTERGKEGLRDFYSKILDGTIDSSLHLEHGEFYKAWNVFYALDANVPAAIQKLRRDLSDERMAIGKANWKKQRGRERISFMDRVEDIKRRYDYQMYPGEPHDNILLLEELMPYNPKFPEAEAMLTTIIDDREMMLDCADQMQKKGKKLATREEVKAILNKYGIGYMAKLIPDNEFAWQSKTIFDMMQKK